MTTNNDNLEQFCKYGETLCRIHSRLVIEGYFLNGGRIWNIFKVATPIGEVILED